MGTIKERKTTRGKLLYDAEVRHKGMPTAYKTFDRRTDARAWINDLEADMRHGRHPPQAEAQRHTLSEAIDRFVTEELSKKRRYYVDQRLEVFWFGDRWI
jgi:hypothetical protein